MKPQAAVFTKDRKATKAEFWKAFRGRRGFKAVQVDEAHAVIGTHAPRYWEKQGWLVAQENGRGELVYTLTEEGKDHLLTGISRFLKNHPSARTELQNLPRDLQ
jgi:hypothetical protein